MPIDLNTPVTDSGLQRIPFFNGRVLTAEDLKTEQTATAAERARLGEAVGTGVIEGLFVRRGPGDAPTTVVVEAGTALAPSGHVVALPQRVEVSVVSETERAASGGTEGGFARCSAEHAIITAGTGAYVLVAEPAEETEGRVPRVGLTGDGSAGACGAQYQRDGARLRLVCLQLDDPGLTTEAMREAIVAQEEIIVRARERGSAPADSDVSMLRNLWAHAMLQDDRGGNSAVRASMGDDAVPLALMYWARDRIEFVDVWSARTVVRPATDVERAVSRSSRRIERFLQFTDQFETLILRSPAPRQIRLHDYARFVPSAFVVPVFDLDAPRGVDPSRFVAPFARGSTGPIRPGLLTDVLHRSLHHPPVDLTTDPSLIRFVAEPSPDTSAAPMFQRPTLALVHRDLGVPATTDGLTVVLDTARRVYRDILDERAFEPAEMKDSEEVHGAMTVRSHLRDVIESAGRAALQARHGSDVPRTLALFQQMYDEQMRLVKRFQLPIEGVEENGPRQRFATAVEARLRPIRSKKEIKEIRAILDQFQEQGGSKQIETMLRNKYQKETESRLVEMWASEAKKRERRIEEEKQAAERSGRVSKSEYLTSKQTREKGASTPSYEASAYGKASYRGTASSIHALTASNEKIEKAMRAQAEMIEMYASLADFGKFELTPLGILTLLEALDDRDVVAAIDAQANVNEYVGRWIGDTIAVGPTRLRYVGNQDGDNLVPPGAETDTFRFDFELDNSTDVELTFRVSAETTAPTGDWAQSTQLQDASGNPVAEVTLDSATSQTLTAAVTPPSGATVGETATLTVRAVVPSPNNRIMDQTRTLPIEEDAGAPTPHVLELSDFTVEDDNGVPYDLPADPSTTPVPIPEGAIIYVNTTAAFSSTQSLQNVAFDITATVAASSGNGGDWSSFDLLLNRASQIGTTTNGTIEESLSLSNGESATLSVAIPVPESVGREGTVSLTIESSDLSISATAGPLLVETVA